MQSNRIVVCVTALILSLTIQADAAIVVDTLEDLGPDTTAVTSRNIGSVIVTISAASGALFTARSYDSSATGTAWAFDGAGFNTPLNAANVSGRRFIATSTEIDVDGFFPFVEPISFDFSEPVSAFGLTTLDLLEVDTVGSPPWISLRAFNSLDVQIDSDTRSGTQGASGLDLDWFVSAPGITKAELTGNLTTAFYTAFGIDDLVLEISLPEPVSLTVWLLLCCVGISAAWRRRTSDTYRH